MTVSVVIPVYNRGPLIEKTVQSVLDQDLPPGEIEILLIEDGSTDGTPQILDSLYGNHPQIRVFHLPNGGVARARNFGLEEARGEFIAFLDHDDIWLPAKLRLQLEILRCNPRVGVAYSSWRAVDQNGDEMPAIIQFQRQNWWRAPRNGRAFPWILLPHPTQFVRNSIVSMSVPLMRTHALREIGGFDPQTVPSDDWDLWIRLAKKWDFALVPQELVLYVHHDNQQHKQIRAAYASALAIYRKHKTPWRAHPYVRFKQETYRRFCRAMLHFGDAQAALAQEKPREIWLCTLRAARIQPLILLFRRWHRLWIAAFKLGSQKSAP